MNSFSARKPNTPYESTQKESAAQSMINLSMAIGGGVGGLAKEGMYCAFRSALIVLIALHFLLLCSFILGI